MHITRSGTLGPLSNNIQTNNRHTTLTLAHIASSSHIRSPRSARTCIQGRIQRHTGSRTGVVAVAGVASIRRERDLLAEEQIAAVSIGAGRSCSRVRRRRTELYSHVLPCQYTTYAVSVGRTLHLPTTTTRLLHRASSTQFTIERTVFMHIEVAAARLIRSWSRTASCGHATLLQRATRRACSRYAGREEPVGV